MRRHHTHEYLNRNRSRKSTSEDSDWAAWKGLSSFVHAAFLFPQVNTSCNTAFGGIYMTRRHCSAACCDFG